MNKSIVTSFSLLCFMILIAVSCATNNQVVPQVTSVKSDYQFDKIATNDIVGIEKLNSGVIKDTVEFETSLNNFKTGDQVKTKAFIYKRINDTFSPKLHVWYHIDTTANELVQITYNWDFYNPSFDADQNEDLIIETNKRETEYQNKYNELNELLKSRFQEPIKTNLINDSDYSFNEMTYFEDENIYAYSRIRFQRKIDKNPMIGLAGNHFVVQMVITYK